jgi:hypothetical protein
MLKTQANELIKLIKDYGLSIDNFNRIDFEASKTDQMSKFIHLPSKFEFNVWSAKVNYDTFSGTYTLFAPNMPLKHFPEDMVTLPTYCNFRSLKDYFITWLYQITSYQNEMSEPDLWDTINNSQLFSSNNGDSYNDEMFSEPERTSIRLSIVEFKKYTIGNINLIENDLFDNERKPELIKERIALIEKRCDILEKSLDIIPRYHWKHFAFETLIRLGFELALDTNKFNTLYNFFRPLLSGVKNYFVQ